MRDRIHQLEGLEGVRCPFLSQARDPAPCHPPLSPLQPSGHLLPRSPCGLTTMPLPTPPRSPFHFPFPFPFLPTHPTQLQMLWPSHCPFVVSDALCQYPLICLATIRPFSRRRRERRHGSPTTKHPKIEIPADVQTAHRAVASIALWLLSMRCHCRPHRLEAERRAKPEEPKRQTLRCVVSIAICRGYLYDATSAVAGGGWRERGRRR